MSICDGNCLSAECSPDWEVPFRRLVRFPSCSKHGSSLSYGSPEPVVVRVP